MSGGGAAGKHLLQFPTLPELRKNEARQFCLQITRDPIYRKALLEDLRARTCAPAVEVFVLSHAWGRPPTRIEVGTPGAFDDLDNVSKEELLARGALLLKAISGDETALEALAAEAMKAAGGTPTAQAAAAAAVDGALHMPEDDDAGGEA
jgi:hypothetical protein